MLFLQICKRGVLFLWAYELFRLEPGVSPLRYRIDTFKRLAEKPGVGAVVWRFDPLILTDKIGIDDLLRRIEVPSGVEVR